jgi:hypothetical protein
VLDVAFGLLGGLLSVLRFAGRRGLGGLVPGFAFLASSKALVSSGVVSAAISAALGSALSARANSSCS